LPPKPAVKIIMAELSGLPVPTMDWGATDPIQAMKQFKALCTLMFKGPLKEKSEQEKVAYLQIWSGQKGYNSSPHGLYPTQTKTN